MYFNPLRLNMYAFCVRKVAFIPKVRRTRSVNIGADSVRFAVSYRFKFFLNILFSIFIVFLFTEMELSGEDVNSIPFPNGSLEKISKKYKDRPEGWWCHISKPREGKYGIYVRNTPSECYDGNSCIKIIRKKGAKGAIFWLPPGFHLKPLTGYVVTCWVKTDITKGKAWLYIVAYNSKNKSEAIRVEKQRKFRTYKKWRKIKVLFITTENTARVGILPRFDGEGTVWFDKFELREVYTPEDCKK